MTPEFLKAVKKRIKDRYKRFKAAVKRASRREVPVFKVEQWRNAMRKEHGRT